MIPEFRSNSNNMFELAMAEKENIIRAGSKVILMQNMKKQTQKNYLTANKSYETESAE